MSRFKISLPGFSLDDDTPDTTAVDSLYPSPKVDTTANPPHAGIIDVNWATTGLTQTEGTTKLLYSFSHNYGYIPSVIGVFDFDNGSNQETGVMPFQYGSLAMIVLDADAKNINLKYLSLDPGVAVITPFRLRVRFYVFAERGHE